MAGAFEHEAISVRNAPLVIDRNAPIRGATAKAGAFSPTELVRGGGEIDWLHCQCLPVNYGDSQGSGHSLRPIPSGAVI